LEQTWSNLLEGRENKNKTCKKSFDIK
jgi:hypothetical protein